VDVHPPNLGYRERRSALVDGAAVWTRTLESVDDAPVLPDGCMDLVWVEGRLSVAGPDTRAYRPSSAVGVQIFGIRFYPGTAPALLGVPAHELRDTRVELAELWPVAQVRRLTAIVEHAPDPMSGLEAAARQRAAESVPPDPVLPLIVSSLRAGRAVAEIADELELGPRRLHRMSLAAFGYGPKTLARVLRMQHALALARGGTPFAGTAARAGYADQAHLAREVREFAGMPLGQLVSSVQSSGA
jgi:AraC-like DNA-binding protein